MASVAFKVVDGKVVLVPLGGNPGEPLRVTKGAVVTWNNQTTEVHHPVAITPAGVFLTDEIPPDNVSDPGFVPKPGSTTTYMCSRHPDNDGEKGSIVTGA